MFLFQTSHLAALERVELVATMAVAVSMPLHTNAPLPQLLAGSSVFSLSATRLISVNSANTKLPVSSLLTSTVLGNEPMDCLNGLPGLLPLARGQTDRVPQGPLPQHWVSKFFINISFQITAFLFSAWCAIKILGSSGLISILFCHLCRREIFVIKRVRGHIVLQCLIPFRHTYIYDSPGLYIRYSVAIIFIPFKSIPNVSLSCIDA